MNTAASSVQSSAGAVEITGDTVAMSTESFDDGAFESAKLLSGFGKRWKERTEMRTTSEIDSESCHNSEIFGEEQHNEDMLTVEQRRDDTAFRLLRFGQPFTPARGC